MDGLCRAIGAPLPVAWQGKMALLYPLRLVDLGMIELAIIHHRSDPLRTLNRHISRLNPTTYFEAFTVAISKQKDVKPVATTTEFEDFMRTRRGLVLSLWMMFRERFSYEDIDRQAILWRKEKRTQWLVLRNSVSGLDAVAEAEWSKLPTASLEANSSEPFNWRNAVRTICEAYTGIRPEDVGQMTLYEFRELITERNAVANKLSVPRFMARKDPRIKQAFADWKRRQTA